MIISPALSCLRRVSRALVAASLSPGPVVLPSPASGLVLADDDAGPGAVRKYGGVPPFCETRCYIISVARSWPERTAD